MLRQTFIAVLALSAFQSHSEEITIYTWEDYISEAAIEQFSQQTGHTVKQSYFEDELARDKLLMGQYGSSYDLVVVDSYSIDAYLSGQHIHSLHQQSEKWSDNFNQAAVAACGIGGVPYTQGTMGIAYRSSVFTQPPTSFANLFDLDYLGDNQLLMPRDDIDTMAVALLALGYHPMSNNQDEIKLAYSELTKQRPQVKEYRTTYDYILEHGSDNDINIALAWTGEVEGFAEETGQDDWVFIAPESGSIIWYDCLAAPTTQPLSDAARSFLTFMSDAQNAAQNSEEMWFHSSHAHIASLVSEELLNDESVYTSSATLDNSYNYIALSRDAIQIRTRVLATLLK